MKRLVFGLFALLLLSVVTVLVYNSQNQSTIRSELNDFAIEDTAAVARIVLKSESGESVELTRQTDNTWTVNGEYQARPDAITNLLYTMNRVRVKAPVSQQAMNTVLKMIIAAHTLVEVYDSHDELIKSYFVGGANQTHTGTNMMMKGSSRPFVTHIEGFHGFLTPRYFTNPREWRHREVFAYHPDEISEINYVNNVKPELNFDLERMNDHEFHVVSHNMEIPYDTAMLMAYLAGYQKVHFESYEETKNEDFIDSVRNSKPDWIITVSSVDGLSKKVEGFKKPMKGGRDIEDNPTDYDIDRLYIEVDDQEFFVAQHAIFDKLTKGVYFLKP